MGSYVYALNTKVREVSGKKLGLADFRYKQAAGYGRDADAWNQKAFNVLCGRRISFFEKNPDQLPEYFTLNLIEASPVYKVTDITFGEGSLTAGNMVGVMEQKGRSWVINFL